MIIVNVKGGLGNQMFQYACGRALARRNQDTLRLVRSEYGGDVSRPFSLAHFNIEAEMIGARDVPVLKKALGRLMQRMTGNYYVAFDSRILHKRGTVYLDGYFQSEKYFLDHAEVIRTDLSPKKPLTGHAADLAHTIANEVCAVSLHVRRGDYLDHPDFSNIATKDYYVRAIEHIRKMFPAATFYVFSDDIEWCRTELPLGPEATHVSRPSLRDFEELTLMSRCSHHIIANSSFSWWGAWLGHHNEQTVIAPERWSNLHEEWYTDIIPSSWTRM